MKTGIPIIISAPSGAGKTTIIGLLMKKMKALAYSVSGTTRPPAGKEKNGIDYFFITKKEFLQKKKQGKFIETAVVHGQRYGTFKEQLDRKLKSGRDVILDIDVVGALNVKKQYPRAFLIFIAAPSMEILRDRMRKRRRDTEKDITRRLKNAKKEMRYRKFYDSIIVNDKLREALRELIKIIKKIKEGEKCR